MSQLALPLQLDDHAVFESFLGSGNETLVAALQAVAAGEELAGCYLWGAAATGKTHLLQAACERAGDRSIYVPLAMFAAAGPEALDGLASRELVCIDDLDRVVDDGRWEAALFDLMNQLHDAGGQMVVAASASPRELNIQLPDLRSRLSRMPVFQLHELLEPDRLHALQLRSRHRGIQLPDETAQYLIRRSRRDMASLYALLDQLDHAALRAQRRLTVPFVRDVLQQDER